MTFLWPPRKMKPMYNSRYLVPRSGHLLAPQLDYILLDGSGSMISKWDETLAGLDAYFNVLRRASFSSHGILHVFDTDNLEYIQRDSTINTWPCFDRGTVDLPGGGTPLYDAINLAVRRLAELDPKVCSLIIVTDGQNTHSQTDEVQARALLDWCRAQGWQVIFLGADFNNAKQARALGGTAQSFIGVQRGRMREAGETLGEKRLRYGRTGADIGFSDGEKSEFGGYLTGPGR